MGFKKRLELRHPFLQSILVGEPSPLKGYKGTTGGLENNHFVVGTHMENSIETTKYAQATPFPGMNRAQHNMAHNVPPKQSRRCHIKLPMGKNMAPVFFWLVDFKGKTCPNKEHHSPLGVSLGKLPMAGSKKSSTLPTSSKALPNSLWYCSCDPPCHQGEGGGVVLSSLPLTKEIEP